MHRNALFLLKSVAKLPLIPAVKGETLGNSHVTLSNTLQQVSPQQVTRLWKKKEDANRFQVLFRAHWRAALCACAAAAVWRGSRSRMAARSSPALLHQARSEPPGSSPAVGHTEGLHASLMPTPWGKAPQQGHTTMTSGISSVPASPRCATSHGFPHRPQ